ncbi:MMPL family transporter [Nocardioides taihuensis]|uniref:MMPL family transporter n=1 Tax=Nocardioides taihuensis TaxID=1835606 RepID=A0ABW0BN35_9ACTN
MYRALRALGKLCARRPFVVVGAWVLLVLVVSLSVTTFGAQTNDDLSLPGTGSQQVKDLLEEKFPPQQNGVNPIILHVDSGKLTDAANKAAVKQAVQDLRAAPHVYSVTNPLSSSGQTAGLLSDDARTGFVPVLLDVNSGAVDEDLANQIFSTADPARDAGIEVEAGGSLGSTLSKEPTESSEVVGIAAAMVILSLVLGSLVAMGLPIITAVVGLATALGVIGLVGHLVNMPSTGATLATMIGLGVGIDYALFLITRHQDGLRDGLPVEESIAQAVGTSGSAIVFAGTTVVIALLSLGVAGIPLVSALGLASAIAVVTAVLGAISLLPALLGLLKHRIAWLSIPAFLTPHPEPGRGMWERWSGVVGRHPAWVALGSLALLVPLIIPVFSLELGQEDVGATDPSTTERKAYDLITAGFGVGFNGPLQVASEMSPPAAPSAEFTKKYDEATSLQKELEKAQKQLPKQQAALEAQSAELQQEQKALQKQADELQAQQAALEAQAADLQAEQASLEAESARLQQQGDELAREQTALERQRDRLREQAQALAAKIRPLARELAGLLARERVLERRIEHAQENGNEVRVARLRARLAEVRAQAGEVRQQLAPLEQRARELAAQAEQLVREAEQLQQQRDALLARKSRLEAQGAALAQQGQELQAQKAYLERRAAVLQQQGDELQAEGDALQRQADELKQEKKQAQQEKKQAEQLQKELTDMLTAAGGDERGTDPRVVALQQALLDTDGVVSLTLPQINEPGSVVLLSAVPSTAPASDETAALLATVRDDVLPEVEAAEAITSYVGGYTASYVDLATLITDRLLLVIGTVILLGYLLLMIAFRSLLIPLQAAVTNLLSAAAAFGVLTACFQWGWGVDLVGLDTTSGTVPIASYVPLMMFAGLFGLSMDYEVFLVSHIEQHHLAGEPASRAAASGLASSARITTAAALIMASVFASFIINGDPTIKQFGVGLSVAVLLAGILVVTLAPAALVLFGNAAWWLPRWLDRLLPHISVEGESSPPPPAEPVVPEPEPEPAG